MGKDEKSGHQDSPADLDRRAHAERLETSIRGHAERLRAEQVEADTKRLQEEARDQRLAVVQASLEASTPVESARLGDEVQPPEWRGARHLDPQSGDWHEERRGAFRGGYRGEEREPPQFTQKRRRDGERAGEIERTAEGERGEGRRDTSTNGARARLEERIEARRPSASSPHGRGRGGRDGPG